MKKFLAICALWMGGLGLAVSGWCGTVFEPWTTLDPSSAGVFADQQGSKLSFVVEKGPKKKQEALKLTYDLKAGGYCGLWHNTSYDLSKAGTIVFQAKTTLPGDLQVAVKDKWNVQYVAKASVPSKKWTEVKIPLSAFAKDPYYTPDNAQLGHPMDLSNVTGMNFAPQTTGAGDLWVGPVSYDEGPAASASAAPPAADVSAAASTPAPAAASASTGANVSIQDFATALEGNAIGGFQDSQGSTMVFSSVDAKDVKGVKALELDYNLQQGGYCGIWCRAGGSDWAGANLTGVQTVSFKIYSTAGVQIGLALKDKNNNQYVADAPATAGKGWETVKIPLSSFVLDPYYTPPDAVKGAPADFSAIKTFNFQPKTGGKNKIEIRDVVGEK